MPPNADRRPARTRVIDRGAVRADALAGLTVALVGLPQCLAYALMSGLPPAYGLSTAIVAGLVAAVLGRSSQIVTGPTNTTGLLVLGALHPYLGANGLLGPEGLPALATLTLLAGVIRIAASAMGGAHLIRFLPESVLVGFTAGAALLIATMQLDEALGLTAVRASGLVSELRSVAGALDQVEAPAMLVAVATVAVLGLGGRLLPRWPLALAAVVAAAALVGVFGLGQASGLPLVADRAGVPSGWPAGAWPDLSPGLLQGFLVPASAIVLLGTLELAVTARAGGARPDLRREMRAQGWANAVAAFFSALPASASLTRSALLRLGGAQTRMAAGAAAAFTLPMLLYGGRFVGLVPQASLAAILFVTAWRMPDWTAIRRLWKATPETRLLLVLTFVATLVLPLEWAVLLGSGTGIVIHLARTSAPRLCLLRPAAGRLVPVAAGERPDVVVLEVSGDLHYAAVPPFLTEAEQLIPDTSRQIVIDLSHAHELRFTALTALEQLAQAARHDGAALMLAGVDPGTRALLDRSGSTLRYVPAEDEPGLSVRLALDRLREAAST